MKRFKLIIILLALLIRPIYGFDFDSIAGQHLTGLEKETGIEEMYSTFKYAVDLVINKDKSYRFVYATSGGALKCDGTYTEDNNILRFTQKNFQHEDYPGNLFGLKGEMRVVETPESLYFNRVLEYRSLTPVDGKNFNVIFGINSDSVKEGARRINKGIPVIVVNKNGTVTTDAKIREKPTIGSASREYRIDPYDMQHIYAFVPKNTKIKVIARTESKVEVGKWINYWYLVTAGMQTEVWMYGEFIDLR